MRYFLTVFLVFIITISYGQPKKGGRVKRKYRNVEQITQNLPDVVLHGRVRDIYRNPIAGATVEAGGLKRKVNTNSEGRFLLKNLPTGILRLKISFIGYRTKTVDYYLQPGVNDQYMALDQDDIHLEPLPVSPQKREQHIPDIPAAITVITGSLARHYNINDLSGAADFIPGSFFEDFGGGEAAFSVNGSSGSAGFPGLSPAVAIYSDNVPVNLPNGFSPTFLDMERVEVIKGPQNVLFGSRAYSGAVSLVSRQPGEEFDGYVIAGGGNFGKKEIQGALNMPVIKDMLYVRAAGIYNSRNGYTGNSGAVSLNGDNTVGGRLSVRFLPAYNHQADLKLNYRNDKEPGTAFLNNWIQNEQGETGLWDRIISLNNENGIGAQNELMDATLTYRLLRDEHTYLTSISSYRKGKSSSGKDADGTSLPALFLKSNSDADLFFQEIRYNFSRRSRTNGSIGINYIRGKGDFQQGLSSNDQTLLTLLTTPGSFVMPSENRFPVNPQTLNPSPMAGVNLPGDHGEHMISNINEQSFQAFLQFTYQLTSRIFFTAGARGGYDLTKVSGESVITGDSPSALGMYGNSDPNLLYSPGPLQSVKNSSLSVSGQAGL
ncbi:MAG: carboxypeptidase-like regulatory domain-containing protein, partial [Prolixibacteraceae bacterium]|nr:carboxypeptidase-like regulatory domain-containing protein [Prolixibacteraceae bacterium]